MRGCITRETKTWRPAGALWTPFCFIFCLHNIMCHALCVPQMCLVHANTSQALPWDPRNVEESNPLFPDVWAMAPNLWCLPLQARHCISAWYFKGLKSVLHSTPRYLFLIYSLLISSQIACPGWWVSDIYQETLRRQGVLRCSRPMLFPVYAQG